MDMKRIYAIVFFLSFFVSLKAQFSVLFVDDSNDSFGNAELVASAIDSAGFKVDYFNAVDSASGPTDLKMANYDLVVWYTSGSGFGLQLWNGADEDNASIKAYLDGGGKMWLIGLDFLFDKYGPAPITFAPGEFIYDYAGIASYDVQSYGDDGNLAVGVVVPDSNAVISGLSDLSWIFSTLWWVDGVTLRPGASPVYNMGGSGYSLAGKTCGTFFKTDKSQVLTYFFDLALVSDFKSLLGTVKPAIEFFEGGISSLSRPTISNYEVSIYPNPASTGDITLSFDLGKSEIISASLIDLQGRLVSNLIRNEKLAGSKFTFIGHIGSQIKSGIYFAKINIGSRTVYKQLLINN